jgi:AraC-like DNA-binding protein
MNRVSALLHTPDIWVSRFDHPADRHHEDPPEERIDEYSISFVETDHFSLTIDGITMRLGPGMVFRTHPGLVFRARHDERCPTDVCLSVGYSTSLIEESRWLLGRFGAAAVEAPDAHTGYWQSRLTAALAGTTMAAEAVGLELVALLAGGDVRTGLKQGPARVSWYRARIERARERLHAEHDRPLLVADLARDAGLSSYHFLRLFRALVGLPPHRYLIRVRLEAAAGLLEDGDRVTGAAYSSGFENLSHFTRSFRRWFGVPPSAWRSLPRADRSRRKVQALARSAG